MNTVGIFAGRGDVLVAMALAFILGFILAWKIRSWWADFQKPKTKRDLP